MKYLLLVAGLFSGLFPLHSDQGDDMVQRLRLGMSDKEVIAAIGQPEATVPLKGGADLWYLYANTDRQPYDILSRVSLGAPYWRYSYQVTSMTTKSLRLFFDDKDRKLIGWVREFSEFTKDKFMHERLTSRLRASEGGLRKGMSHKQVHAEIGPPQKIIQLPEIETREIYEHHFWLHDPYTTTVKQLEIYTYSLPDGNSRRVYLGYYPGADKLWFWGYDHAREEADRYLREQATKK